MKRLRYFTLQTLERLRGSIPQRMDWYYSASADTEPPLPVGGYRESAIEYDQFADRLRVESDHPSATDAENALVVYQALKDLSALQASDERLWAHLSHFDCIEYVKARWLSTRPANNKEADSRIRNHFFATGNGNRSLVRDNGISRLWWLGKFAFETSPRNPNEFLQILLHRQDVRSALIERPSVSMNPNILRAIFEIMKEYWNGDRKLFEREAFRFWMRALNRRGGIVLLDALPEAHLLEMLRTEAKTAVHLRQR